MLEGWPEIKEPISKLALLKPALSATVATYKQT
jgi:hypothetical protein